jgi:predicted transcriptional regulator
MKLKTFTFKYEPTSSPRKMFERFWEAVDTGKKNNQPRNVLTANRLDTIYRITSQARLDILSCLVEQKPNNIQELAQLLQRDYANVWRDIQALNGLKIIKLKKEGKEIRPIALYEKIIIEFPIISIGKEKYSNISLSA